MANHKSAAKRARQSEVKKTRNLSTKNSVRTFEKKLRAAIAAKDASANELLREFSSRVAKAAQKGVVHAKAASRKVSRLASQVSTLTK